MSPELRRFPFVQFDVFSSRPFEGNSLAVFSDGRGLSDQLMQALAREMNLSETTFVLPRDLPPNGNAECGSEFLRCRRRCPLPAIPRWAPHLPYVVRLAPPKWRSN